MISKNCNFQMLITFERKVPQRSDATRNDRKGHLPSQKLDDLSQTLERLLKIRLHSSIPDPDHARVVNLLG